MKAAVARKAKSWAELTAGDVMERKIVAVAPSSPVSEVERLLTEHRISGMPVVDASGRAIGVVSYRDLLDHDAPQSGETVADVMTPAIVDVTADATLAEVCRTMSRHAVHRVLVTERGTGRMLGIVSSLGVLGAITGD